MWLTAVMTCVEVRAGRLPTSCSARRPSAVQRMGSAAKMFVISRTCRQHHMSDARSTSDQRVCVSMTAAALRHSAQGKVMWSKQAQCCWPLLHVIKAPSCDVSRHSAGRGPPHQAREGQLPDEQLRGALVVPDLPQRHSARPEAVLLLLCASIAGKTLLLDAVARDMLAAATCSIGTLLLAALPQLRSSASIPHEGQTPETHS